MWIWVTSSVMTSFKFRFDFHWEGNLLDTRKESFTETWGREGGCFGIQPMCYRIRTMRFSGTGVWYSNAIAPSTCSYSNSDVKCSQYRNKTLSKWRHEGTELQGLILQTLHRWETLGCRIMENELCCQALLLSVYPDTRVSPRFLDVPCSSLNSRGRTTCWNVLGWGGCRPEKVHVRAFRSVLHKRGKKINVCPHFIVEKVFL